MLVLRYIRIDPLILRGGNQYLLTIRNLRFAGNYRLLLVRVITLQRLGCGDSLSHLFGTEVVVLHEVLKR